MGGREFAGVMKWPEVVLGVSTGEVRRAPPHPIKKMRAASQKRNVPEGLVGLFIA
jgi:hypothetical protein